jgi:hypothetical protein
MEIAVGNIYAVGLLLDLDFGDFNFLNERV